MAALFVSVFLASLLGSLHCAGMCGGFLAIAVNPVGGPSAPRMAVQAAYHGGRLLTYLLLGTAAGAIGAMADLGATLAGLQPIATAIAGGIMVAFGGSILLRLAGIHVPRLPLPPALNRIVMKGSGFAMNQPPILRAWLIGLMTTLLPCGWLYAFAAVAGGTANAMLGGLVMAAFWAGTLPVMIALGAGIQKGLGAVGRRLPVVTSVAVIVVGLYTLVGRSLFDARAFAAHATATASVTTDARGVAPSTQRATLPCCVDSEEEASR